MMWLLITLVLLMLYVLALPYFLDAYDEFKDEIKGEYPLGVESSHARPVVMDGEIVGFRKEASRDG